MLDFCTNINNFLIPLLHYGSGICLVLQSVQSNGRASVPPSPQHEDSKPLAGTKSSVPSFSEEVTKQQITKKPTHPLVKAEPSNGQPSQFNQISIKENRGAFNIVVTS